MWYSIVSQDVPESLQIRMAARPEHLARLEALKSAGKLLIAGPNPAIDCENPEHAGFTGSVVIAEFDSLEDAQQWADTDPFVTAGVCSEVRVKPFKKVLP